MAWTVLTKVAMSVGRKSNRHQRNDNSTGGSKGSRKSDQKVSRKVKNEQEAKEKDPTRYYTLMGESYVHGMMDGEALRKKFYGDIADQTFELR